MELRASSEDYLETVFVLQVRKNEVRSIDLARHMGVSKASVSHAVKALRNGGFLVKDNGGLLHLTNVGHIVAEAIYERHSFFRDRLMEAGIDRETAEQESCRMKHIISKKSFEKIKDTYHKANK